MNRYEIVGNKIPAFRGSVRGVQNVHNALALTSEKSISLKTDLCQAILFR